MNGGSLRRNARAGVFASWHEQWERSVVLRLGVLLAVAVLAIEGLLRWADLTADQHREAVSLRESNAALRAQLRQGDWAERQVQAERQLQAFESMLWTAPDAALVQAGLQDWVRSTASRTGVVIRDVSVARQTPADKPTGGEIAWDTWRVRVGLEFKRVPVLTFLGETTASPRALVAERVHLRLAQSPGYADLEFRAVSKSGGRAP